MHIIHRIFLLTVFVRLYPYNLTHNMQPMDDNRYTMHIQMKLEPQEHIYASLISFTTNTPTIIIEQWQATPKALSVYDSTRKIKTLCWENHVSFALTLKNTHMPIAPHAMIFALLPTNMPKTPWLQTIPLNKSPNNTVQQSQSPAVAFKSAYLPYQAQGAQKIDTTLATHPRCIYWYPFDHSFNRRIVFCAFLLTILMVIYMMFRHCALQRTISTSMFLCAFIPYLFWLCAYVYQHIPSAYCIIPITWLLAGTLLMVHDEHKKISITSGLIMLSIGTLLTFCALLMHKGLMS